MRFSIIALVFTVVFIGVIDSAAQKPLAAKTTAPVKVAAEPEVKAAGYVYKGITLGMSAEEVRTKLGEPKDKSDPQDLFVFSEDESAQFIYGADKKISAIMITFSGKLDGAPTTKEVFGEEVAARADGGVSKMVRYEKAGYWIAYNKIVGDQSVISIAMQKLR